MWRLAAASEDSAIVAMSSALYCEDPAPWPVPEQNTRQTLRLLRQETGRGCAVVLDLNPTLAGYALLISFWSNELGGEVVVSQGPHRQRTRGNHASDPLAAIRSLCGLSVMADVFTKAKRSEVMSRIRGRGNRNTEITLVRIFRANRIAGWRRHAKILGKPDFTFRKQRVAIFVDGCFWHGCPRHSNMPANNREFWAAKLAGNRRRDRLVTRTLRKSGWKVIRIWEHDLARRPGFCVLRIAQALGTEDQFG